MEAKLFSQNGKEKGVIKLDDSVFGAAVNEAIIHEVVVAQLANKRQGTKSALTRSEVRGGGIKPYRQKGTGRARQGSIRSPQFVKGGVVFAPKPRDFSKKINKKVKQAAFISAVSAKVRDNEVIFIDDIKLNGTTVTKNIMIDGVKTPKQVVLTKTKDMAGILDNFNLNKKTLLVLPEQNDAVYLAAKNIPNLTTTYAELLSVYDIMSHAKCLIHAGAVKKLEEAYKD